MVYSDTSGKSGLLQHCEQLTSLGDGAITGNSTLKAYFTAGLNRASHRLFAWVIGRSDEWDIDDTNHGDYPVLTAPLTTNRELTLPVTEKVLRIKKLWLTYDGSNYVGARPFDSGEANIPQGNDTQTDENFSITDPRYDIKYGTLWIYPKASAAQVAAGAAARIEWTRELDEFTTSDTTQEPGWLDEPFHPLISGLASFEWSIINSPALAGNIKAYLISMGYNPDEETIGRYYGSKTQDRELTFLANPINYK